MYDIYNNKKLNELIQEKRYLEIQKCINGNNFITYNFLVNKYYLPLSYGCYFRKTDDLDTIEYNTDNYYELKNMLDYGLFKIDDNIEAINAIKERLKPFSLYEYIVRKNKLAITFWGVNKDNKELTGNAKLCYPLYYAYNVDDTFLYKKLVKSHLVGDLDLIKDKYPYIRNNFYTYETMDYQLGKEVIEENVRKLTK